MNENNLKANHLLELIGRIFVADKQFKDALTLKTFL